MKLHKVIDTAVQMQSSLVVLYPFGIDLVTNIIWAIWKLSKQKEATKTPFGILPLDRFWVQLQFYGIWCHKVGSIVRSYPKISVKFNGTNDWKLSSKKKRYKIKLFLRFLFYKEVHGEQIHFESKC